MKLNAKQKKILKIAILSLLAVLEIYLIYAASASMYTYHQHPRFESADGQAAQSSGYKTQFFLCLAFTIAIPALSALLVYLFWFKKPKAAAVENSAEFTDIPVSAEAAAAVDEVAAAETSESDDNILRSGEVPKPQ